MLAPGKYIYGIIAEPQHQKFSFSGLGEAEVYTVNYQKLAAVVSDTELREIDPLRKNVLAHTIVQDRLLQEYTLLPMGFGIITSDEDGVWRLLAKNYDSLVREIERLAGKIEAELKVFWNQEAMMKQMESEGLTQFKAAAGVALSPGETQTRLIKAGRLVERIAQDWQSRYAERAWAVLRGLSIEALLNNLVGVKNILNASFLLEKCKETEFKEEVYRLDSQYQDKVNFKYVGPLPPYNFIKVHLEPVA